MLTFFTLRVIITSLSVLQFVCGQSKGLWFYDFPHSQIDAANSLARDEFPESFMFGVAISSYQNEGAWNVSGKTMSIWDYALHEHPEFVLDSKNGDTTADFYHRYKEDIQLAKGLGCKAFRFSISWPRLLPTGFTNYINEDGIRFYNDVINELIANGMEPMVTVFHADIPLNIHRMGSFLNPLITDLLTDYARVAFELFGDRVKLWITINEPTAMCVLQNHRPEPLGYNSTGIMEYECLRNMLLAHTSIYRMYHREFASQQKGKVGFTFIATKYVAKTDSEDDRFAEYSTFHWLLADFLDVLLAKRGDIPTTIKERVNYLSYMQGFPKSRLKVFTDAEVKLMKGSTDFVGLNFYHAETAMSTSFDPTTLSYAADMGVGEYIYVKSNNFTELNTPWALRVLLDYLLTYYDIPEIYITEAGYLVDESFLDTQRALYIYDMLKTLLGLLQKGYSIKAYLFWTLTDNFAWFTSFVRKPGVISIDFNNASLPRTPKLSSKVLGSIYNERRIKPIMEMLTENEEILAMEELLSSLGDISL